MLATGVNPLFRSGPRQTSFGFFDAPLALGGAQWLAGLGDPSAGRLAMLDVFSESEGFHPSPGSADWHYRASLALDVEFALAARHC